MPGALYGSWIVLVIVLIGGVLLWSGVRRLQVASDCELRGYRGSSSLPSVRSHHPWPQFRMTFPFVAENDESPQEAQVAGRPTHSTGLGSGDTLRVDELPPSSHTWLGGISESLFFSVVGARRASITPSGQRRPSTKRSSRYVMQWSREPLSGCALLWQRKRTLGSVKCPNSSCPDPGKLKPFPLQPRPAQG